MNEQKLNLFFAFLCASYLPIPSYQHESESLRSVTVCVCVHSPCRRTGCKSVWDDTGTAGSLFHYGNSRCLGHSGHSADPLHWVDMGTAHSLGHTHTHRLHTCGCQCPKAGTYTLITHTYNRDKTNELLRMGI